MSLGCNKQTFKKGLIQKHSLWMGGLIRGVWPLIKKTCAKRKTTFLVKVFTEGKKVVGKAFLSAKLAQHFWSNFS